MANDPPDGGAKNASAGGNPDKNAEQTERLAQALRANLRRRKAQTKARNTDEADAGADTAPPASNEGTIKP